MMVNLPAAKAVSHAASADRGRPSPVRLEGPAGLPEPIVSFVCLLGGWTRDIGTHHMPPCLPSVAAPPDAVRVLTQPQRIQLVLKAHELCSAGCTGMSSGIVDGVAIPKAPQAVQVTGGAGGHTGSCCCPSDAGSICCAAIFSLCRDMQAAADSWCIPDWLCVPSRAHSEEAASRLVPLRTVPDKHTLLTNACTNRGPVNSTAHLSERAWCPPGARVHGTSGCWCGGPWASCWGPGGPGCLSWHLWSLQAQHRSSRQVGHLWSQNVPPPASQTATCTAGGWGACPA